VACLGAACEGDAERTWYVGQRADSASFPYSPTLEHVAAAGRRPGSHDLGRGHDGGRLVLAVLHATEDKTTSSSNST
jgi:hypothetical protein